MNRFIYIFAVLIFFSSQAVAQEAGEPSRTETLCGVLSEYEPQAGVEYQPGVDILGNPVAPADLNEFPDTSYQTIVVPIEIDLIERFGLDVPDGVELKPKIADLEIHRDGHVEYQGHDISDQAYRLCVEKGEERLPESRQRAEDAVPSGEILEGQHP